MSSETRAGRNELGDVTITITGNRQPIAGWSGLQIVRAFDSAADSFAFSFPWEATADKRQLFRAYETTFVEIKHRGTVVVSGIMEKLSASYSARQRSVTLEGRGRSGVLVDLSAKPAMYTGKFNAIAARIAPPTVRVLAEPDFPATGELTFDVEVGQTMYQSLSGIAAAHGYWALPRPDGSLRFSKFRAGRPVAKLEEGSAPAVQVLTDHDLTKRFYRYSALSSANAALSLAEAIDRGVDEDLRDGRSFAPDVESDPTEAANYARARGLIDSYNCSVTLSGWTHEGRLWAPGDVVTIEAPSAMIYRAYDMIVAKATLQLDETGGAQTELILTFPAVYAGGLPVFPYPWTTEARS